ncbi:hypothetical protein bsdtb5_31440 [Anaeromicropila herbilytica]|uniref:Uncharacterized protein n=1 Tax=Anaeromicropila herbilytica TaxID=2785025 RepID=A0A7R7IE87_9FIRM|nr:hypothetical protein bsdtb5_31440 [Anaeromicropila herbilytica]
MFYYFGLDIKSLNHGNLEHLTSEFIEYSINLLTAKFKAHSNDATIPSKVTIYKDIIYCTFQRHTQTDSQI